MEKVNKAIDYSEFAGCCVFVETLDGCALGLAGFYEEGSGLFFLNDTCAYPEEEMITGAMELPLDRIIFIRKASPLERFMYFKLWDNLRETASQCPSQPWRFSEEEVKPYLGKMVVLDFYDAENIEDHYIGKLVSYDGNNFEFTYAYDVYQGILHRELSVEYVTCLRFPSALEKSLYDKVVKGLVWVS